MMWYGLRNFNIRQIKKEIFDRKKKIVEMKKEIVEMFNDTGKPLLH